MAFPDNVLLELQTRPLHVLADLQGCRSPRLVKESRSFWSSTNIAMGDVIRARFVFARCENRARQPACFPYRQSKGLPVRAERYRRGKFSNRDVSYSSEVFYKCEYLYMSWDDSGKCYILKNCDKIQFQTELYCFLGCSVEPRNRGNLFKQSRSISDIHRENRQQLSGLGFSNSGDAFMLISSCVSTFWGERVLC